MDLEFLNHIFIILTIWISYLLWRIIRQATIDLIRRAERANFKALVVTVDTAVLGRRLVNERHGFDLPPHLKYSQVKLTLY